MAKSSKSRVRQSSRTHTSNEEAFLDAVRGRRTPPSKKPIQPLNDAQREYDRAIATSTITFGLGPAGTGKTWLAAMRAAEAFRDGRIEQLIITRPAVEAGEELGFLPGEMDEKFDPYFRPVRDALVECLGSGHLEYAIKAGTIEARPLAFLRGATFKNAIAILDEAQNTTPKQMKMFLTRIGEGTRVIVNGDPLQKDIPGPSGLEDAVRLTGHLPEVSVINFTRADIVRSGIVRKIIDCYEA